MLSNVLNSEYPDQEVEIDKVDDDVVSNILTLAGDNATTDDESDLNDEDNSHSTAVFIANCNKAACAHVLSPSPTDIQELKQEVTNGTEAMGRRYDNKHFHGLLIDSGCSFLSTGDIAQYLAYCRENRIQPQINTYKRAEIGFANKRHTSSGTAKIRFPVANSLRWLECEPHLLPIFLRFLRSLQDMDQIGLFLDTLANKIVHKASQAEAPFKMKWCHVFITWTKTQSCFFTEQELRNMHRRFGHPGVAKLSNLLKRATGKKTSSTTFKLLRQIQKHCVYCQRYRAKPHRFKFTLRDDSISFNDTIYCDVLTIERKSVAHG